MASEAGLNMSDDNSVPDTSADTLGLDMSTDNSVPERSENDRARDTSIDDPPLPQNATELGRGLSPPKGRECGLPKDLRGSP